MSAGAAARFGATTLTLLVVANMVGAGVFTTSGYLLASLRHPSWVVLAWVLGGIVALAGAVSYGALVRAMPESGGEYVFLSRALHPLAGFVAGWVSLIAGFSGAIAFAATALESYLVPAAVRPAWLPGDAVAIAAVLAAGAQHGWHARLGARLQNVAVALKLVLLVGIVGWAALGPANGWQGRGVAEEPLATGALLGALAGALVWISLSYSGFNAAVYVAEEAEGDADAVPRALVKGTAIVVVLYVLLNALFVYGPPSDLVAGRPDVAAVAAGWLGGPAADRLVRGVIALALLTSISSMLMAAPRVYAKMAADGVLPATLRFRGQAPGRAVVAQVLIAIVLVLVASLRDLLGYLGMTLSLSAALSVACLLLPSVRRRLGNRAPRLAPLVYLGATAIIVGITVVRDPSELIATAATFAVGAVAYGLVRRPPP